jgi:hypothetical protein
MASFKKATVVKIISERKGLVKVKIDLDGTEAPAIAYPDLTGSLKTGDEVIVNTTALELGLGSGGFHIIVWNLGMDGYDSYSRGHIMKMRYTPLQMNCLAVEEEASGHNREVEAEQDLRGMPVIAGTLHSQLPPAVAVIKRATDGRARVAYIMTDRAALPISLSDTVVELKEKNLLDITITIGQAFGGDLEAVNIYSALTAARAVGNADIAVVAMGVGVVGTETLLGFSGIEQGEIVNAAHSLKGRPVAIPRINFKDPRPRHQGLSEQTVAALTIAALVSCELPVPRMDPDKMAQVNGQLESSGLSARHHVSIVSNDETQEALDLYGLKPTTMGRPYSEEPEFFRAAGSAGMVAAQMTKDRLMIDSQEDSDEV